MAESALTASSLSSPIIESSPSPSVTKSISCHVQAKETGKVSLDDTKASGSSNSIPFSSDKVITKQPNCKISPTNESDKKKETQSSEKQVSQSLNNTIIFN